MISSNAMRNPKNPDRPAANKGHKWEIFKAMVEGECAKTKAKSERPTEKNKNNRTRDFSLKRSKCFV